MASLGSDIILFPAFLIVTVFVFMGLGKRKILAFCNRFENTAPRTDIINRQAKDHQNVWGLSCENLKHVIW